MQRNRYFYLLTILCVLMTSCQAGAVTTQIDAPVLSYVLNDIAPVSQADSPEIQTTSDTQLEESECLICHSDKERLIETADPAVALAESESSGVG